MKRSARFGKSLFLLGVCSLFLAGPSLGGQRADYEWQNPDVAEFQTEAASEVEQFRQEQAAEVQAFLEERDREFLLFLREAWTEIEEFQGISPPLKPKPVVLPTAPETPLSPPPLPGPPVTFPKKKPAEPIVPEPAPEPVKPEPPPAPSDNRLVVSVSWLGQDVQLLCDPRRQYSLQKALSQAAIADFWETQARLGHKTLVAQLAKHKESLQLNDWGYYRFVRKFSSQVQQGENESVLLTWFLLVKSGYRVRLGYADGHAILLAPSRNMLYSVPFYRFGGERYFNVTYFDNGLSPGQLKTYGGDFAGAEHAINLRMKHIPVARASQEHRTLKFSYAGTTHEVPVAFCSERVRFLHAYPQTDIPVFFQAAVARASEESLLKALAPLVEGRPEQEAVNLLLRFVQSAFKYKTDGEQFGREKYLFVEETLHFPYSDCEDRSILFSYLVRRLTGLETVALTYPNHIATAVRFSSPVEGESVEVEGARFVICDPTYVNANVGVVMPQFRDVAPEVLKLPL